MASIFPAGLPTLVHARRLPLSGRLYECAVRSDGELGDSGVGAHQNPVQHTKRRPIHLESVSIKGNSQKRTGTPINGVSRRRISRVHASLNENLLPACRHSDAQVSPDFPEWQKLFLGVIGRHLRRARACSVTAVDPAGVVASSSTRTMLSLFDGIRAACLKAVSMDLLTSLLVVTPSVLKP